MDKVKYSPETKEQTVKYVLEGNMSATMVAKKLETDTNCNVNCFALQWV